MSDAEQRMQVVRYEVKFLTPAFLGNAEQAGQWRTPPFKALLRQWWRVAVAKDCGYEYREVRNREGLLFGHAWLEGDKDARGKRVHARSSQVRIRLSRWDVGQETQKSWNGTELRKGEKIGHQEVGFDIGPLLYLGYGPLKSKKVSGKSQTQIKSNAAVQAGETAELAIAVPGCHLNEVQAAFVLMDAYGTLGGRSRNGWGSASFTLKEAPDPPNSKALEPRMWTKALERDWPHAIGRDNAGPLIWEVQQAFTEWKSAMKALAELKFGLRTQFKFNEGQPHPNPRARHWLSYPVTKHSVKDWHNLRLPNSLRFKLRPEEGDPNKLRAVIFHMPCLPPKRFRPDRHTAAIKSIWLKVHQYLDFANSVQRIGE